MKNIDLIVALHTMYKDNSVVKELDKIDEDKQTCIRAITLFDSSLMKETAMQKAKELEIDRDKFLDKEISKELADAIINLENIMRKESLI